MALFHHGVGGDGDDYDRTRLVDHQATKIPRGPASGMGYRIVEILNVGIVAGLLVAIGGFFWANRLLPLALSERSFWEIRCFFYCVGPLSPP